MASLHRHHEEKKSEVLASRLKQRNVLKEEVKTTYFRHRHVNLQKLRYKMTYYFVLTLMVSWLNCAIITTCLGSVCFICRQLSGKSQVSKLCRYHWKDFDLLQKSWFTDVIEDAFSSFLYGRFFQITWGKLAMNTVDDYTRK